MKRTVHKATDLPTQMSPVTKGGSIIYSRVKEISDIDDPTQRYIEELTPDSEDAIKVLKYLDELNGIRWTSELVRIEKELRTALLDLMTAEQN